mmetsp:Transcript_89777/g.225775  ORF Transcript_89777/g.225775 Transcript_89777/m.225775 type:complete len:102 (+) Transcript_89777:806-1111(+)
MFEDECAADESLAGRCVLDVTVNASDRRGTFSTCVLCIRKSEVALAWPWLPSCFTSSEADRFLTVAFVATSCTKKDREPTSTNDCGVGASLCARCSALGCA